MPLQLELLKWDSEFFGYNVARIFVNESDCGQISALPQLLKESSIKVAYIITKVMNAKLDQLLIDAGAFLVDKKTTFFKELSVKNDYCEVFPITEYNHKEVRSDLFALVIESGVYSRFLIDSRFGRIKYEELYAEWIEKSINGQLADVVYVSKLNDEIVGFITIKKDHREGAAQIGLIAVSNKYRGKKIGLSLMAKAEDWCYINTIKRINVVTQGDNLPACQFYKANGYAIESVNFYYHLWNLS